MTGARDIGIEWSWFDSNAGVWVAGDVGAEKNGADAPGDEG